MSHKRRVRAGSHEGSESLIFLRQLLHTNHENGLYRRAANFLKFIREFDNALLLFFANHAQLSDDVSQLFDVLIFDHQVHGVLSQALNDG